MSHDASVGAVVDFPQIDNHDHVEDTGTITDFMFNSKEKRFAVIVESEKWQGKKRLFFSFDNGAYWLPQRIDIWFPEFPAYNKDEPKLFLRVRKSASADNLHKQMKGFTVTKIEKNQPVDAGEPESLPVQ